MVMLYSEELAMRQADKSPNPEAARELLTLMRAISQEHYAAGWWLTLETDLWAMVHGGSRETDLSEVPVDDVNRLRALAVLADGWWRWDSNGFACLQGETFVRLDVWRAMVGPERVA